MASRIPSRIGTVRTAASAVDSSGLWKVTEEGAESSTRTWLVLTDDVATPAFPAGTLVLITQVLRLQSSPTVYENQNPVKLAKTTATYCFKKLVITTRRVNLKAGATVGCAVMPNMITDQRPPNNLKGVWQPAPAAARMFVDGERVYTVTDSVPDAHHAQYGTFKVPVGTRVKIASRTSRDGPGRILASNDRHPTAARYILNVPLEIEERQWVKCGFSAAHECFRLPRVDEMALIRKFNGPPADPEIVSFGEFD